MPAVALQKATSHAEEENPPGLLWPLPKYIGLTLIFFYLVRYATALLLLQLCCRSPASSPSAAAHYFITVLPHNHTDFMVPKKSALLQLPADLQSWRDKLFNVQGEVILTPKKFDEIEHIWVRRNGKRCRGFDQYNCRPFRGSSKLITQASVAQTFPFAIQKLIANEIEQAEKMYYNNH